MDDFDSRWNISLSYDPTEEFSKTKKGLVNSFGGVIESSMTEEMCRKFAMRAGIELEPYVPVITIFFKNIEELSLFCKSLEFLSTLVGVNIHKVDGITIVHKTEVSLKDSLEDFLESSLRYRNIGIEYDLQKDPFKIITYPKGEKILDETLVNQPLGFLDPKSQKLFIEALKEYEGGKGYKSVEMLRKCLEEFLRIKLGNNKNRENNKTELLKAIGFNSGNKYITNIVEGLFTKLEDCFNNISKHKTEEISDQENEFLIYQVGLLLRYINRQI